MKIVMINDCAYVGDTVLRFLPEGLEKMHVRRTRSLWSKTLGVAWKILRAKGDVYHVHYLLQDCYIASKFGKRPLIGHAHGNDIKSSIKHRLFGRIVRYNLENCDRIFVSTADLIKTAKQFRPDAEYIPNSVNTNLFYPRNPAPHKEKRKVLVGVRCDWEIKRTDIAIRALSEIKDMVEVSIIQYGKDFHKTLMLAKSLGLNLNILPKVPHESLPKYYWNADIVVGTFGSGGLDMISLEAVSCGRPAITYVSSRIPEYKEWPLKEVNTKQEIADIIQDIPPDLWKSEYRYLEKNHNPQTVADAWANIYEELLS